MEIDKIEYIKSLNNVKLVLGNGFDLHCKLSTSYNHFFCKNKATYDFVDNWFKLYLVQFDNGLRFFEISLEGHYELLNVWDFFFALNSNRSTRNREDILWCDIEKAIHDSLLESEIIPPDILWDNVFNIYQNKARTNNERESAMACVILNRHGPNLFYDIDEFYEYLLDELKIFEHKFGSYIGNRIINEDNPTFMQGLTNEKYYKCVKRALGDICDINKVVSIDSFNFSYPFLPNDNNNYPLHFINGNYLEPIFGVDSTFAPDNPKFRFTKGSRRVEQDLDADSVDKPVTFDHLIVYGHSLNKADRGYFFNAFDSLELLNDKSEKKLIFGYSIYKPHKEKELKKDIKNRVANILFAYGEEKGIMHPERLLEKLFSSGRLLFFEVPEISDKLLNYHNFFDVLID